MHLNNRADFADFKAVEQIFEDQSRDCHLKRQQLHWALHGENMGPGGVSPVAGIALGCVGGVLGSNSACTSTICGLSCGPHGALFSQVAKISLSLASP